MEADLTRPLYPITGYVSRPNLRLCYDEKVKAATKLAESRRFELRWLLKAADSGGNTGSPAANCGKRPAGGSPRAGCQRHRSSTRSVNRGSRHACEASGSSLESEVCSARVPQGKADGVGE